MDDQLDFVYRAFGNKRNATGNLLWPHAFESMLILRRALIEAGEIDNLANLSLTALGHDLLEDTSVKVDEIESRWGDQVSKYILGLTKEEVDKGDQSGYIEKLSKQPEEVWLVKLADIVSNVGNSIVVKDTMPPVWRDTFWFPLLRLYQAWYSHIEWKKYPITGIILKGLCDEKIHKLI